MVKEKTSKTETWKPVFGWEGLYDVSDCGRVRALYFGNHGQYKPGRIIKPSIHQNEYIFVTLFRPETRPVKGRGTPHPGKARSVHSLVLEAFKEPRPYGKVARHLDGVRTNNTPENLAWGTISENCDDAKRHGTFVIGEKNGFSILTENDVKEMRRLRRDGLTYVELGSRFKTHYSNVMLICKRRTWQHVA